MNEFQGIIVIDLDGASIIQKILASFQNPDGQTYLVNADGYFLAHPDATRTLGFDLQHELRLYQIHPRLTGKLRNLQTFVEIVNSGEFPGAEPHIHGFQKIKFDANEPNNYWVLVFEIPSSLALEPILQQRNRQFALGAGIALLGAIAVFFWSARITRPLMELTIAANHIAGGNYDRRVAFSGKRNEIHELSTAFDQMVESLLTSERRFAGILDAAGDAIISVDQNQIITTFNNEACQVFGYRLSDILGRPLEQLLPQDTIAVHQRHFRAYGHEDGSMRKMGAGREVSGRRSDGSVFPAEISISKTDAGGGPIFTAIVRDATARKCAEAERAQFVISLKNAVAEANRNQAQLEAVFHAMEDGIAVLDMQGNLILLNEAEARINGYADPEEMKRNLSYFAEIYELTEVDGTVVPVERWPASRCLNGETIKNWVLHGRRADTGQEWYFRFSGAPIYDQDGEQILAAIVTRDITEFKKAESEIRRLNAHLEQRVKERTAELEAANDELEAFSYSVSHDLRAPLRAIDGFSQALLEDYGDQLDETGREYLKRVRSGSVRMANLIDDILQLSRVSRAGMQRQSVNLSAQAESVLSEFQSSEPNRQVEIKIKSELEAVGDPNLLRIALVNLFSNAWKFTGLQSAPSIEFGAKDRAGERTYYVRDNGVGFDMAYVDKLFGAFQRLHSEQEFPGTGIGLAIVQRIVHRHGGRIWAESVVNQGTTIYFTIPTNNTIALYEHANDK
jgi:PAS domain S-box-containing protein